MNAESKEVSYLIGVIIMGLTMFALGLYIGIIFHDNLIH